MWSSSGAGVSYGVHRGHATGLAAASMAPDPEDLIRRAVPRQPLEFGMKELLE